ncbi:MAG: RNA 2',3'-cyclic phosphodiesterase [Alphaproteobacteria bacterium]|nr:RNA 2',3'-cyclic phosphodiesterase [Alphaproteobacteria bacterium]
MPRLFSGIELPEEIRDDLGDLERPLPGVRWIDIDELHLTLRFAGDVDNPTAREFADLLANIEVNAFPMRLSGLGTFGGKDPRVIWAGVEAGEELERLARANERAAHSAGIDVPKRAFKPHVTLARVKHSRPDLLARYLQKHGGFRSETFYVTHFTLFSAKPHTGGGPYIVEETFPLFGGGFAQEDSALDPGQAG